MVINKKNFTFKRILIIALTISMIFGTTITASAELHAPTSSFTHWGLDGSGKTVEMRPVFEAIEYITARGVGLTDAFGTITDMDTDANGNIYILTANSSIFVLDKNNKFKEKIEIKDNNGQKIKFDKSNGIFVDKSGEVYITDTTNQRVLIVENSVLKSELFVPDDALIPSDFEFKPMKVAKDSKGYTYVICEGSYYGAILYDPNNEFIGFYGANTVRSSVLTALTKMWENLTMNDTKRAQMVKLLPYQFVDICVDDNDFVYTCTGKNSDGNMGQIKMLSPGGSNILSGSTTKNFGESDNVKRQAQVINQNFINVEADGNGFIYALDSSFGLIYVYDTNANMITAFGGGIGNGKQLGTFSNACALTIFDDRIYVADAMTGAITVFKRTDYGNAVFDAQRLTLKSDYINAGKIWKEVYKQDPFNCLAIYGLAKEAYEIGEYKLAMNYAKDAGDKETYSLAYDKVKKEFFSKHFTLVFISVVTLLLGIAALLIFLAKKKIVIIKNNKIRIMFSAVIHPFQAFSDIKYKKAGSLYIAVVLTLLFFFSNVIKVTLSDFRYTTFDANTYNVLFQLVQTVGLIVLWSLSNWAVCILSGGIGKISEVYLVTAYSTLPISVINLIITPITHFLSVSGSTLISGLNMVGIILTGIMVCVALMQIHDFTFPRMFVTALLTIVFMILVVFVIFMVGVLLSQTYSFVADIIVEMAKW